MSVKYANDVPQTEMADSTANCMELLGGFSELGKFDRELRSG